VTVVAGDTGARTRSRARRAWQGAAGLCACLLAVALAVALPGAVERYDGPARAAAGAPRWAAPCERTAPRNDRILLSRCAHVQGRVLYVNREGSPPDTHLAVVAKLHLFLVKLRPTDHAPGPGSTVSVVGPLMRADNGLREVQVAALEQA
jgi:hypothetical protein